LPSSEIYASAVNQVAFSKELLRLITIQACCLTYIADQRLLLAAASTLRFCIAAFSRLPAHQELVSALNNLFILALDMRLKW
jgi:hypothetical protein